MRPPGSSMQSSTATTRSLRLRADWDDSALLVARIADAGNVPSEGTRVSLSVRGRVVAWTEDGRVESLTNA